MYFPVAGVTVSPLIPLLAAAGISLVTSMGGVSGAFVLLPFQVSVLGFAGPAVTPTNHLFNVIGIPPGVYRFVREGRMLWPLAAVISLGTVPGVVVGSILRVKVLPDPHNFKLFMGCVLLLIGGRLAAKVLRGAARPAGGGGGGGPLTVRVLRFDRRRLEYEYAGERHSAPVLGLVALTLVIGVIGGAYGVGGGAIISPLLISLYDLPVQTIAGATLSGTCLTSVVGVVLFALARPVLGVARVGPDWALGGALGLGGVIGMYCGARLQRRVPTRAIEGVLALLVCGLALRYVVGFFL